MEKVTPLEKTKNTQRVKTIKKQPWWLLIVVGGLIVLTFILGSQYGVSNRVTIPIEVVGTLIFGSMWLWMRANATATGDEWWQDDSASGWRGY